jgi:putative acetyltransferase
MDVVISADSPLAADVQQLLMRHWALMHETTPPEDNHYLDTTGLLDPAVSFFASRDRDSLLAIGALVEIEPTHGEVKSMHTAAEARGRGIGRLVLDHLIAVARERGYTRVSLETGSMAEFAPARRMYEAAGFVECEPFADYSPSVNSTFMTLDLRAPTQQPD